MDLVASTLAPLEYTIEIPEVMHVLFGKQQALCVTRKSLEPGDIPRQLAAWRSSGFQDLRSKLFRVLPMADSTTMVLNKPPALHCQGTAFLSPAPGCRWCAGDPGLGESSGGFISRVLLYISVSTLQLSNVDFLFGDSLTHLCKVCGTGGMVVGEDRQCLGRSTQQPRHKQQVTLLTHCTIHTQGTRKRR